MPAVVSVLISKRREDVEKEIDAELKQAPMAERPEIPEELIDKRGMIRMGGGSGFIVREDGIILSNKHVLSDKHAEYTVVLHDGRKFPAKILSRDPIDDVAIVKIEATGLPTIPLGDALDLELGQSVIAIGNALGIFQNTVSLGIVSGLSRAITAQADMNTPPQEMRGLVQTDAAINPGNSGGPLVNMKGRVIGINSAIVFGAQNIGFAIPINAAKRALDHLKKYGRIRRPLLGLRYVIIDEHLKDKLALPVSAGALVTGEIPDGHAVVPGSPADHAGFREGDIVLAANGTAVDRDHPIQDVLETMNVGEELTLRTLRDGKEFDAKVTLAERK